MNLAANLVLASSLLPREVGYIAAAFRRWANVVKEYEMSLTPKKIESSVEEIRSTLEQIKDRFSTDDHRDVYQQDSADVGLTQLRANVDRILELHGRLNYMMTELQGLIRR